MAVGILLDVWVQWCISDLSWHLDSLLVRIQRQCVADQQSAREYISHAILAQPRGEPRVWQDSFPFRWASVQAQPPAHLTCVFNPTILHLGRAPGHSQPPADLASGCHPAS